MAYRDLLFRPLVSVFVVSGLPPITAERFGAALGTVAGSRRTMRAHPSGRGRGPDGLSRRIARSVHTVSDEVDDAELIGLADEHGLSGLPIALTVSGDRCAVALAHHVYDGSGSLQLIHDLLDAVAGVPLEPESPPARLPVLQALRRVRLSDVRRFVEARRGRPESPVLDPPLLPAPVTAAAFALSSSDLALIRRYREPDRAGRATLLSRIASLIVAALREVAVSEVDIPVWMTSDIRHLVDGPVDGNFITRELIGILHDEQWAPGALAARMSRLKEPGQALALVWGPTGWLLRSALGRKPVAGEEIVLTLATTQRSFPVPVKSVLATSIGGSPTFGFALQTKDSVYVSVYNSSGRFDLDRFEAVFRRIVAERAGMTAG